MGAGAGPGRKSLTLKVMKWGEMNPAHPGGVDIAPMPQRRGHNHSSCDIYHQMGWLGRDGTSTFPLSGLWEGVLLYSTTHYMV